MNRLTEKISDELAENPEYMLKYKSIDNNNLINKFGEHEDFVESIIDFYGMDKDSDLLEILETLFVFKTSYVNLTNRFDELAAKYRDLLEKNNGK